MQAQKPRTIQPAVTRPAWSAHPFIDGNKRTGFMAAYIFLDRNGFELTASEAEATAIVRSLAAREIDESALAVWDAPQARLSGVKLQATVRR